MIYEYKCNNCNTIFDEYMSIIAFKRQTPCPRCEAMADVMITGGAGFVGTKVEHAEYNPGLGTVFKNSAHRKALCKERGLEEVGNENINKYYDKLETERKNKLANRWED